MTKKADPPTPKPKGPDRGPVHRRSRRPRRRVDPGRGPASERLTVGKFAPACCCAFLGAVPVVPAPGRPPCARRITPDRGRRPAAIGTFSARPRSPHPCSLCGGVVLPWRPGTESARRFVRAAACITHTIRRRWIVLCALWYVSTVFPHGHSLHHRAQSHRTSFLKAGRQSRV